MKQAFSWISFIYSPYIIRLIYVYIYTVQIQIRTACMALKELIVNNKQCSLSVVYIRLDYMHVYMRVYHGRRLYLSKD